MGAEDREELGLGAAGDEAVFPLVAGWFAPVVLVAEGEDLREGGGGHVGYAPLGGLVFVLYVKYGKGDGDRENKEEDLRPCNVPTQSAR